MWRFCDTRSSCTRARIHRTYFMCCTSCEFKTGFDESRKPYKIYCKRVRFPWFLFRRFDMRRERLQYIESGRILVNFRNPEDGYYMNMRLADALTSILKVLDDNGLLKNYEFTDSNPESMGYTPYELRRKLKDGKKDEWLHGSVMRDT